MTIYCQAQVCLTCCLTSLLTQKPIWKKFLQSQKRICACFSRTLEEDRPDEQGNKLGSDDIINCTRLKYSQNVVLSYQSINTVVYIYQNIILHFYTFPDKSIKLNLYINRNKINKNIIFSVVTCDIVFVYN